MRQALHILRKDARKLWPGVALSWLLLSVLTMKDAARADYTPTDIEGMLNLLLPTVWACLIGLLVQEEGFIDDRAFWLTRPYRRTSLASAKLLFGLLFIHAAVFVSDCWILAGRGFLPWDHIPHLLRKQFLMGVALTVPAGALAAVTRSFPQFAFVAATVVTVAVTLRSSTESRAPWLPPDNLRRLGTLAVVAAGAAVILWLQYSRRRTLWSRGVGLGCATAAVACTV